MLGCKADSFDLEYLLLLFTIAYVSFLLLVYVLHVSLLLLCDSAKCFPDPALF